MPFKEMIENNFQIERCKREAWDIFKAIHLHNCYEIYYMEEGEIVYFIDEHSYTAHRGDFIIIPPGAAHKTLPYHSHAHTRILIYLKLKFIQPMIDMEPKITDCLSHKLITMVSRNTAERILGELLAEAESSTASPALLRALMTELLVYLSRMAESERPQPGVKTGPSQRIEPITDYIRLHYAEELTLAKTAAKFYITPSYLSRIFPGATGRGFSEYLTECRLKGAVYLLNNTNKKISEIAAEVGFHSDNHFCKTFKKVFGISPRRYRNSGRNENTV